MTDHACMNQPEILATESNLVRTGSQGTKNGAERADYPLVSGTERNTGVSWQMAMKRAIRSTSELRKRLNLPTNVDPGRNPHCEPETAESEFPTFVPIEFLDRIEKGDPNDPLLLQVMTTPAESVAVDGFDADPVGDMNAFSAPSVLHKYQGRALVIASGACGVHCRYCFRREFPYSEVTDQSENWQAAIDYIASDSSIDEVILSGGDPLTLVDEKLFDLIDQVESIDHVRRLRIHTRMPIVIPQRITDSLVERLLQSRLAVWFVVHANHPNELSSDVLDSLAALIDVGIPVLNQAVLLRNVNDRVETLRKLCQKLVDHRIAPYYLHQLDRVRGASHFEVPVEKGLELMQQLRQSLPGYAVPTYVYEQSGEPSKTQLT